MSETFHELSRKSISITLNYSAFIFVASFIAENSATRREDKQTKCNNAEHTFATDNKRLHSLCCVVSDDGVNKGG